MVRIVHPIITSAVGRALELFTLGKPTVPMPQLLPIRRSILTVDKPVGEGQPNQETDVLLVRLMLNLIAATDAVWRDRFKTPMPHDRKFDAELGRRVRAYQQAGGFQMPVRGADDPPTPVVVTSFLRAGSAAGAGAALADAPAATVKEALFADGVIDPCKPHTDRGSRSKLVYTVVHFNYHLLLRLRVQSLRLTPKLIRTIDDVVKDPKLAPLRSELEIAERSDPDKPRPDPNPSPNPPVVI